MGFHTVGPVVNDHISQKWQENQLQYVQLCAICGSWFISKFFNNNTFTYFSIISSSQDSVFDVNRDTENPVPERCGSTSEELRGETRYESTETETENKNKNGESEEVQRDVSHELLDWLLEFRENLVDDSTQTEPWNNPEQGSQDTSKSSHELPMAPRAKVEPGSGKHSVFTHFPKDPNCDICLKTREQGLLAEDVLVQSCPKRNMLLAADHKILSEESESRNNHRYAVVVQGLATQWIQSYRVKQKLPRRPRRTK